MAYRWPERFTAFGVNDNIIEASLQALVNSVEYALVRESVTQSTT